MIQETNPEVKRRSPNLSSNRRPCSLECGWVNSAWEGKRCVMNILPAEDKVVCREDAQASPRTLSTGTQ